MPDNGGTSTNPQSAIRDPRPKFDPITLEILWRRLVSIVDEADASVARTAAARTSSSEGAGLTPAVIPDLFAI